MVFGDILNLFNLCLCHQLTSCKLGQAEKGEGSVLWEYFTEIFFKSAPCNARKVQWWVVQSLPPGGCHLKEGHGDKQAWITGQSVLDSRAERWFQRPEQGDHGGLGACGEVTEGFSKEVETKHSEK